MAVSAVLFGTGCTTPLQPESSVPEATQARAQVDDFPELMDLVSEDWFGAYLVNEKVGWMRMAVSLHPEDSPHSISFEMEVRAQYPGYRMSSENVWTFELNPPRGLLAVRVRDDTNGTLQNWEGVRKDDVFQLKASTLAGESFREIQIPQLTFEDLLGFRVLGMRAKAVGDTIRTRSFGVQDGETGRLQYKVMGIQDDIIDGVAVKTATITSGKRKGESKNYWTVASSGTVLEVNLEGVLQYRRETKEMATDLSKTANLLFGCMVRSDRALGDTRDVSKLVVRWKGFPRGFSFLSDCGQTVLAGDGDSMSVAVDRTAVLDGSCDATEVDRRTALLSTSRYPCEAPEILECVGREISPTSTPRESIKNLLAFVNKSMTVRLSFAANSGLDVLKSKKGACTEHAMLFVTLCRAAGIPAREVHGYVYGGDGIQAFAAHAWTEVCLDGRWVGVDPTLKQFPIDASYIGVRRESGKGDSQLRFVGMGRTAEILSFETIKSTNTPR